MEKITVNAGKQEKVLFPYERTKVPLALGQELRKEAFRKRLETLVAIIVPLIMFALWELCARFGIIDIRFFSAPSLIAEHFWKTLISGELINNMKFTVIRIIAGFGIGASVGTACGIFMGLFPRVRAAVYPLILSIYPIPKIALLPLLLMTFGFTEPTRFLPGALSSFFLTSVSTLGGVLMVKKIHLDVARNMGASQSRVYTTVAVPGALPMIFAGIRLGWGMAMVTTITVEMMISKNGLGFMLWNAWEAFEISQMFVAIVVMAIFGLLSFALIDLIQARIMRWKPY